MKSHLLDSIDAAPGVETRILRSVDSMNCIPFQIMFNGKTLITMDRRNVVFSVVQDRYGSIHP